MKKVVHRANQRLLKTSPTRAGLAVGVSTALVGTGVQRTTYLDHSGRARRRYSTSTPISGPFKAAIATSVGLHGYQKYHKRKVRRNASNSPSRKHKK